MWSVIFNLIKFLINDSELLPIKKYLIVNCAIFTVKIICDKLKINNFALLKMKASCLNNNLPMAPRMIQSLKKPFSVIATEIDVHTS